MVYAIGDVHGRSDLLQRMAELIRDDLLARPGADPTVVLLGDYLDRGPDSRGVIEGLAVPGLFEAPVRALRGNHEEMLLTFLSGPEIGSMWRRNGAVETLYSYGVDVRDFKLARNLAETAEELRYRLPASHLAFLESAPLSCAIGDYFFCHAGVRPGVALEEQRARDLLWIRDDFLGSSQTFPKIVVHGHTPVGEAEIHPNRINVDTGAYISNRLSCLVLEGEQRRFLVAEPTR